MSANLKQVAHHSDSTINEYMNEKQRRYLENMLLTMKSELIANHRNTITNLTENLENYADPLDQVTHNNELTTNLITRERETKLIKKIDKSLFRIADDDYGYCDDCGAEIGIKRLKARPTADLCIDCKTATEIKERVYA